MSAKDLGDLLRLLTKYIAFVSLATGALVYSIETRQMAVAATDDIAWMKKVIFATYVNSLHACMRNRLPGEPECVTDLSKMDTNFSVQLKGSHQ